MRIGDYAYLSDCSSGALVSRDGSVEWLCMPRFDSPSLFGAILDPKAGRWELRPTAPFQVERHYLGDSLVLVSRFHTLEGVVDVVDAMAFESGARGHEIGLRSPHVLVRQVRGITGEVRMRTVLSPRFEYALTTPRVQPSERGVVMTGGSGMLQLTADVPVRAVDMDVAAEFVVAEGQRVGFSLAYAHTFGQAPPAELDAAAALEDTLAAWASWAEVHWGQEGVGYEGLYVEQVRRSALVMQGLTYQPSGAVVAAPTTSLPERLGGEWNWDYRYAWLRDASLMMRALWVAACPDEPEAFFRWIDNASGRGEASKIQVMYGIEGERDLSEHVLGHLGGFGGSRPVRVGNDAWRQKQLDVVGEVLDAALLLDAKVPQWSRETSRLLTAFADNAASGWREPDCGMWEARDHERHYTSSKVMCWVALDRGLRLADRLGVDATRRGVWARERDSVRETILREAWVDSKQAFTGAFGSTHLDASVLLMPLVGFIDAGDERMRRTIEAVERELGSDGLVRRWAEEPNGFLLTSWWLVRCLARMGELERARERFEAVAAYANDLGLLAEEGDPGTGELVGNLPQAFSHVGLINAAWELTLVSAGESPETWVPGVTQTVMSR